MAEEKQDVFDRKVDGVVKLAKLDSVKVMLIVSSFFNIYQYIDNRDLNAVIVDEVRRQVDPAVEKKVSDGLEPIKKGVNDIKDMAIEVKDKIRKDSLK